MTGHVPKKKYGQNFLTAPHYIDRIVSAISATEGETVVEIGPGKGALSKKIASHTPRFSYHLIEMDRDLQPYLEQAIEGEHTLHFADATKFDYRILGDSFHAVGNLPYNVASHIIKKILFESPRLKSVTFMVQKEVAERICATPRGKTIGFMTILCSYFGVPRKICDVPPGAFFPKPKVTSSVFHIDIDPQKTARIPSHLWGEFFHFVSIAYGQRRKKLASTIASMVGGKACAESMIAKCGFSESVRPEELCDQQWVDLFCSRKLEMSKDEASD